MNMKLSRKLLVRFGIVAAGLLALGPASAETFADGEGWWAGTAMPSAYGPQQSHEADFALFQGLIPGEPLAEEELALYFGKNIPISINVGGDGVITFQGDFNDNTENNNNLTVTGNTGIAQVVPVIGNNNDVDINVSIVVNINTVTIQDSNGSDIAVTQVLDFNGVFSGPFSR